MSAARTPAAGAEITVEIESLAPGGDAVGRQRGASGEAGEGAFAAASSAASSDASSTAGRVTFVALAAPGERVRARLEREKGRVAWAELVAIERPGPDRIVPPCPVFGACGGCQWQHVTPEAQRAAKRAIVARALGIEIPPVIAAVPPYGYRDRAKLAVGPGGRLGFRARRSHDVVGLDFPCPLFGPELARAMPALRALASGLPPGVELEVQAGAEGVHLEVARADAIVAAQARSEIARLAAAGVVGLAVGGRQVWGVAAVDVAEPGSPALPVPASGFAQVGRAANAALVAAVLEAVGRDPGVVVELYAGGGNFTRHLVARAAAVHASDGDPAAVERGRRDVPGAAWAARPHTVAADTVVLDPPREGADRAHLAIAARAGQRVVYVSCDPQTLGRDKRALEAAGLRLVRAVALDLMPQTFHVEVVATFQRG